MVGIRSRLIQLTKKFGFWPGVISTGAKIKTCITLGMVALAVGALFSMTRCAVVWDGEIVAVASERQLAEKSVRDYFQQLEKTSGMPVKIQDGVIKYYPIWRIKAVDDQQELQRCLAGKLDYQYEACGIFINGKKMVAVRDASAGREVLDKILHTYSHDGQWEVAFKQDVAMKKVLVDIDELLAVDRAVEAMQYGGIEVKEHQVQAGDTLWDVAVEAKIPVEELLEANPGLAPGTMQIGQEIKIARPAPLVDVLSTYENVLQEEIACPVREKVEQELYWGEQRLMQAGSPGLREVVYKVTLENGLEKGRKAMQQKIIKEPVPQIIAKGNKKLLAFRGGSGRLAYPTSGAIVSPFGERWGRAHQGVDIAAGNGTPIVAAEAGTVESAGNQGGYGLCVDIRHGNGVVTRYAHLSSAAVESGQRLERGQFIGRVGSSGNSTGPHLHFEVIVNGAQKDPALFI